MNPTDTHKRFVFKTHGVCPPEIHFKISAQTIQDIRFVGGGCPGNAQLVARLLEGRSIGEVMAAVDGIACRNDTSCPDQLSQAIRAVEDGRLAPAESFCRRDDGMPRKRIGLIGDLGGDTEALEMILAATRRHDVDAVFCLGNLTGPSPGSAALIKAACKADMTCLQGEGDWRYAEGRENPDHFPLNQRARDILLQMPQVLTFNLGDRKGVAFYGEYIQELPGYSDFEPFALEMNMVCGLTRFMTDETVFPALEAMVDQFAADLILFGQAGRWGHWHVAGKDFVSVGNAFDGARLSWGLMEADEGKIRFQTVTESEIK